MAISDPDEIRAFAGRLSKFADQLEELTEQTTRGLRSAAGGWQDDAFDEFDAVLRAAVDPIKGFTAEGRDYASRLQERAALVDRVAAHATSGGAGASIGASAAGSVGPLGATAGAAGAGAVPAQASSGRYHPSAAAVPAGGFLAGFANGVAYKTSSGGAAFLRNTDGAAGNALRVQPFGKCLDLMMHGYVNKDGSSANSVAIPMANGTTQQMNAQQFAKFLIDSNGGRPITRPIRLCACKTGQDRSGFAAQLARELGVPVVAPVQSIWFDAEGRTLWSAPLGVNNRATWRAFAPDGRAWQAPDWATGSRAGWDPI